MGCPCIPGLTPTAPYGASRSAGDTGTLFICVSVRGKAATRCVRSLRAPSRACRHGSLGRGYRTLFVCISVRASCHPVCPFPPRAIPRLVARVPRPGIQGHFGYVLVRVSCHPPWAPYPQAHGARRTHKAWPERTRGYGPLKQVVPPRCERGERLAFAKPRSPLRLPRSPGSVLLSRELPLPVSSALEGLTVVFGMGTRVSPPLWPPGFRVPVSPASLQPRLSARVVRPGIRDTFRMYRCAGELSPGLGPVSPSARRTHKAWPERARGYGTSLGPG